MKKGIFNIALLTLSAITSIAICNTHASWPVKSNEERVKEFIDETADVLKRAVDKFGDNLEQIQYYLDHYQWKGIVEDEATIDPVTLKHLQLNGHSKIAVVRPGERVEGKVKCKYTGDKCSPFTYYRVILGVKGEGAKTTIGNTLGAFAGETEENFVFFAPTQKGVYQIRFQPAEAFFETKALAEWRDPELTKPIGFLIVH